MDSSREKQKTGTKCRSFHCVLLLSCIQLLFLIIVNIQLFQFEGNLNNISEAQDSFRESFRESFQNKRKKSFSTRFGLKKTRHQIEEREELREDRPRGVETKAEIEENEELHEGQEERLRGQGEQGGQGGGKGEGEAEAKAETEVGGMQDNEKNQEEKIAGLSCEKYGGPSQEIAQEMVYWSDIPSDSLYVSPFHMKKEKHEQKQYLTFEMDRGGWNNKRMALEVILAMAFATGRTLVIPAEQSMYMISQEKDPKSGKEQRVHFSFNHFFPLELIHKEHPGLDIITMEEFLQREAMTGNVYKYINDSTTTTTTTKINTNNHPAFPPNNRTNWDGCDRKECKELFLWLRTVSRVIYWNYKECVVAFPKTTQHRDIQTLLDTKERILNEGFPSKEQYIGNPLPVNARTIHRMRESLSNRTSLCLYDEQIQKEPIIHFPVDPTQNDIRLLVHYYSFLFFQDWKQDLWMKRFIRDHFRYIDEIQCAAARIVHAIRQRARQRRPTTNMKGEFDSMHIRRSDFQTVYKTAFVRNADVIYNITKSKLIENGTIYISTDDNRPKQFFKPLMEHYDVVFLKDFQHLIQDINTNYYGMVEQVVASKGRVFFGCWFSTFTGYINRMRGYHSQKDKLPGYEDGIIKSWYYQKRNYGAFEKYYPMEKEFYAREWPSAWRLIDTGIE